MKVFTGKDYSSLYRDALKACLDEGEYRTSRVGAVYDIGTACFEIQSIDAGLPYVKGRGVNPFFALAELAWFYMGSNELSPLQYFIHNYDQYSDDGISLYGAYGYRVRFKFDFDQLECVINQLKVNPNSRRAVISFYTYNDLEFLDSRDIPCNLSALFKIRNSRLDMTVFNRSNDVFKGIPYNFFLFRFLQYLVAKRLDMQLGVHRHITDSLHLYESDAAMVEHALKESCNTVENIVSLDLDVFDELINSAAEIHSRDWQNVPSERLRGLFLDYKLFRGTEGKDFFRQFDVSDILGIYIEDWLATHHSKLQP